LSVGGRSVAGSCSRWIVVGVRFGAPSATRVDVIKEALSSCCVNVVDHQLAPL
jgi:hypothetical protein